MAPPSKVDQTIIILLKSVLEKSGFTQLNNSMEELARKTKTNKLLFTEAFSKGFTDFKNISGTSKQIANDFDILKNKLKDYNVQIAGGKQYWLKDLATGKKVGAEKLKTLMEELSLREDIERLVSGGGMKKYTAGAGRGGAIGTLNVPKGKAQDFGFGPYAVSRVKPVIDEDTKAYLKEAKAIDEVKNFQMGFMQETQKNLANRYLAQKGVNAMLDEEGKFRAASTNALIVSNKKLTQLRKLLKGKEFNMWSKFADDTKTFKGEFLSLGFMFMMLGQYSTSLWKGMINGYNAAFEKTSAWERVTGRLTSAWTFLGFQIVDALASSKLVNAVIEWFASLADTIADMNPKVLEAIGISLAVITGLTVSAGAMFMFLTGFDSLKALVLALGVGKTAGLADVAGSLKTISALDLAKAGLTTAFTSLKEIGLLKMVKGGLIAALLLLAATTLPDVLKKAYQNLKDFFDTEKDIVDNPPVIEPKIVPKEAVTGKEGVLSPLQGFISKIPIGDVKVPKAEIDKTVKPVAEESVSYVNRILSAVGIYKGLEWVGKSGFGQKIVGVFKGGFQYVDDFLSSPKLANFGTKAMEKFMGFATKIPTSMAELKNLATLKNIGSAVKAGGSALMTGIKGVNWYTLAGSLALMFSDEIIAGAKSGYQYFNEWWNKDKEEQKKTIDNLASTKAANETIKQEVTANTNILKESAKIYKNGNETIMGVTTPVQGGMKQYAPPNLKVTRTPLPEEAVPQSTVGIFDRLKMAFESIKSSFSNILASFELFKNNILANKAYPKLLGDFTTLFDNLTVSMMVLNKITTTLTTSLYAEATAHQAVANSVNNEAAAYERLFTARSRTGAGPSTYFGGRNQTTTAGGNSGGTGGNIPFYFSTGS